ncbi:N-acetylglucosamine kinase [Anaerolactibacter massiliensis]|uniref:N-acetylglucosamine kinase n=1 Tax=Anaerolactibacter massiliensis TaxID=2044573 RepID=UPI000CF9ED71|nr:BadF/BadG/BcrA/BcrD ATPase family protein [Anaerolactibacter massiliensis]
MEKKYYLGIDCGGTKTSFLLTDEAGKMVSVRKGPPANYLVNGLSETAEMLKQMVAGIRKEEMHGEGRCICFLALAGYGDIPEEKMHVDQVMREAIMVQKLMIGNDTENAIAGSLIGKPGIHLIAGTGSIGIGIDLDGNQYRAGGWHHLFGGDEGSGYWIACRLLEHFTKQADGREEKTRLYDLVMQRLSLKEPEEMLSRVIEEWNGSRDRIASLSRMVLEGAEADDPVCRSIYHEAAAELSEIAAAVARKGNFGNPIPVSWSGGVFCSGEVLLEPLREALPEGLRLMTPFMGPAGGGVLLAMKADGHELGGDLLEMLRETDRRAEKSLAG